jgi:prepilin-type N-terminal cleavage/methylation domain-containing protein
MPTLFKAQNGVIGLGAAGTLKPGALSVERTYRQTVFSTMPIIFCRKHNESPGGERGHALLRQDDGFTLIETLIAAVVLVIGLMGLFGLLDVSVKASASTRAREGATSLAREIIEDARTIPYAQLSPTTITKELKEKKGLETIESGFISRRGSETQQAITYTVTVSECAIDDPKNGYGVHKDKTLFCSDSQTEGSAVTQPEDLKRMTAEVSWTFHGRTSTVKQVETLTAAGEAVGLGAIELHLVEPPSSYNKNSTAPVITTEPASKELAFSVKAPVTATAVSWSLDGTTQTPAPLKSGSSEEWTFSWPITGLSDGTYQVSAQAVSAAGVYGPPISIPVTLIRGVPVAPKPVKDGFNKVYKGGVLSEVAEFQWPANTERNVIGYRVRRASSPEEEVCPGGGKLNLATSCIDFNPPTPRTAPEAQRTYSIAALYRDANGVVQEGAKAPFTLSSTPATPIAPTGLKLKKEENGSVKLTWTAPSGEVAFYRIYRVSKDYTERYAVAFPPTLPPPTYTDTDATGPHRYWVTAVSSTLTESWPSPEEWVEG